MNSTSKSTRPGWLSEPDISNCLTADAGLNDAVDRILLASPFLTRLLKGEPEQLLRFANDGPDAMLEQELAQVGSLTEATQAEVMTQLREARARIAVLVALADLSGRWSVEAVTLALSRFADAATDVALCLAVQPALAHGHIIPRPAVGDEPPWRRCGLAVIAMGKHGAQELNYSSDIDLVLVFDEQAVGYAGPDDLTTAFVKVAQTMLRLLQERTGDGYVFRVDLRLRPDPNATPIALSMGAAEVYYQSMALAWERAAYIKARAVAGDLAAGEGFLKRMRPFVWRRHLDFTAMRDINAIKAEIHDHHGHDDPNEPGYNVKLGRGGIREIEFFAQIQQLIGGGREPQLRSRQTLETLATLARLGQIPQADAEALTEAYRFLRTVEHRLQMMEDAQTQTLPTAPNDLKALAMLCGFASPAGLLAAIRKRSALVRKAYVGLLPGGTQPVSQWPQEPESLARMLAARGFADPAPLVDMLERWRRGRYRALRADRARDLIETLLPSIFEAAKQSDDPLAPLLRFDELLSRLPAGVQLLSVFDANPRLLDLVFRILVAAPQLGDDLAREPSQLDVLLDPGLMAPLPDHGALAEELEQRLNQTDGLEHALDEVRRWRAERQLQLGVQLLESGGANRVAADCFSRLADVAMAAIKCRVEAAFAQAHGSIDGGELAVLALGRYGGCRLSVGSDLDLVMLFVPGAATESDGRRPLNPTAYFNRLAQRLITALTVPTASGALYEVDTRLRPSGEQGLLAVTLPSFAAYQNDEAWTWEHMALTRCRVVAAQPATASAIKATVDQVLGKPRNPAKLKADVLAMRQDLRKHAPGKAAFDVKFTPGGMIDAEFIAQYLQLREAAEHPSVIAQTLEASLSALADCGALSTQQAKDWTGAYQTLSRFQLLLRLTRPDAQTPADLPIGVQQAIARSLGLADMDAVLAGLDAAKNSVRQLWSAVF
jgi:[glutamine synthetase] adenylyltransferase / [glutamine synthetase]-adenylyl-L-tyrosine phosphorylase